jgi:hypothetical protein
VGVYAEDPVTPLLGRWNRHRGFERTIHTRGANVN